MQKGNDQRQRKFWGKQPATVVQGVGRSFESTKTPKADHDDPPPLHHDMRLVVVVVVVVARHAMIDTLQCLVAPATHRRAITAAYYVGVGKRTHPQDSFPSLRKDLGVIRLPNFEEKNKERQDQCLPPCFGRLLSKQQGNAHHHAPGYSLDEHHGISCREERTPRDETPEHPLERHRRGQDTLGPSHLQEVVGVFPQKHLTGTEDKELWGCLTVDGLLGGINRGPDGYWCAKN